MTYQQTVISGLINKFPNAGSRTIARIAYRENKELFPDEEAARTAVRRARGNQGDKKRHLAIKPRPNGSCRDTFGALPKPREHFRSGWGAVQFGGPLRALILADVHIPYHDSTATAAALDYGKERQADFVLLNGDIADCYAQSFWETDPRERDFPAEIEAVKQFLGTVRSMFPKARIVYKLGNHEERHIRYLMRKAPELLGVADFEFESVFGLKPLGIQLIGGMRPIRLGKLNVIHGHEYRFSISNPVNPARGFFLRAKTHCLGGHLHQSSQHSEKNLEQKVVSTWSTGCLCDLHPEYRPLNGWNHGFAFVEVDTDGVFNVQNLKIIDGKTY